MRPSANPRAIDGAAVFVILAFAAWTYLQFLPEARMLWSAWPHDRNGHFNFAVELALALRAGDPGRFFAVLSTSTVWGPLHGLILSPILAVGGLDHRLGVLPSLLGWVLTVAGAGWLARELAPDRSTSLGAGAMAIAFALAGTAHRSYAVDVMLESLGAGLTVLALACYVRAIRSPESRRAWRMLAIVLTLLFLEKVNYWALAVCSLTLATAWDHRAALKRIVAGFPLRERLGAWLVAQTRRWDNALLLTLIGVIIAILARGPTAATLMGRTVSLYPPGNLATLAYAWLLTRMTIAAWRARADLRARWPAAIGVIAAWHVWPVAWSLAIPRRLGPMLWYLGPANSGDAPINDPWSALTMYARAARGDYLAGEIGVALLAIGVIGWAVFRGRLRPGANAALALFLVATLAVAIHPNQKPRFLHSWFAAGWVVAAVGLAMLGATIARARRATVIMVSLAAIAVQGPHLARTWLAAPFNPSGPASELDLTDAVADLIDQGGRVAVLGTVPFESLASWTTLTRTRDFERFERVRWWRAHERGAFEAEFAAWLAITRATHVAVLDIPSGSWRAAGAEILAPALVGLPALMRAQDRFAPIATRLIDGVEISTWRRRP